MLENNISKPFGAGKAKDKLNKRKSKQEPQGGGPDLTKTSSVEEER